LGAARFSRSSASPAAKKHCFSVVVRPAGSDHPRHHDPPLILFLLWIGDNQKTSADYAVGSPEAIAACIGIPISAEGDVQALSWLRKEIDNKHWFEQGLDRQGRYSFRLTLFGSQRYEQLKKVSSQSRTAFMALKFCDPVLDDVVEKCFKPAVLRTGFELRKLSDKQPDWFNRQPNQSCHLVWPLRGSGLISCQRWRVLKPRLR
jgi:hypothetical protein